jgi:hypothetical protein
LRYLNPVLATCVLVASIVTAVGVVLPAFLAAPASALGSCDTSIPVVVSYTVGGQPGSMKVSAVELTGFPVSCDGATVVLQLWGNSAGDPSVPMSGDTLLSMADSTLDPCTKATLATPLTVTGGNIDLPLCPTGGAGGDASVHDLTLVALTVNGLSVPTTLGVSDGKASDAATSAAHSKSSGILAFTGANIVAALAAAILSLLVGLVLFVVSRRAGRVPLSVRIGHRQH